MTRKTGLGRGLGALLSNGDESRQPKVDTLPPRHPKTDDGERIERVAVEKIAAGAHQARRVFDESALQELTDSIKAKGVLVPLIVRRRGDGFELIAGERRWRAAQAAGLSEVPVIVREESDEDVHALSLIENIQRENLNPVEEARAYQTLIDRFGYTQEKLGERLGRTRSTIANLLRLLRLPDYVLDDMAAGTLSMGHARALLAVDDEVDRRALRDRIVSEGMSVRDAERAAAAIGPKKTRVTAKKKAPAKDEFPYGYVLDQLRAHLATKVHARGDGEKGVIEIHYYSADELTRIVELIGG